ncbi:cation:proton antiporter [Acuticoccus sp. MNP-M23]|uniref:cation:proton antiporter domain-containing protein n=1 Tax=Acuticoccus sp. MNP-M23 TaxID=3072793 RepID=UPI0028155249|nr:cation:proton antiporter [Acuticoccus sp. MNP-M23]WMS41036.1 cation:proton antiporter [Acuticoccus sp. MNP-M23]
MEHEVAHGIPYIKEALIFLVSAGIFVPVLQRIGLNPILGYLVAGVIVGPFGIVSLADSVFGIPLDMLAIPEQEGVGQIAELGVVFLLFLIGLELSGPRLWAMRKLVFGLGGAQVLLTAVALTAVGRMAGLGPEASVAVGASLALSSTAIVVQLLVNSGRFAAPSGRVMFAILLMQDIAVVPVLLVIGALGANEATELWRSLFFSILTAAILIPLILLAGRSVIGPVFRFVGARRDRDMFTAAALLVIIGTAAATQIAGLSMALGAFLAGLVFADTEFRHQLEAEIEPFKGLLLGLFFLSVGMTIDPRVIIDAPLTLLAVVVTIIAVKAGVIFVLALLARQPLAVAVESALMLGQIGEFSLVGLSLAMSLGVIEPDVARIFVVAAGVTMALTTAVAAPIRHLAIWLEARGAPRTPPTSLAAAKEEGHVIIAGFGRIGQSIGHLMDERRIPYTALDRDPHEVARARRTGKSIYFGDVRRTDVLKNAGAGKARAVILTMDNPAANAAVLEAMRRAGIDTPVVVRARDVADARALYSLGADQVVMEAFEASLQMGEETLVTLGFPREAAHAVIAEQREAGKRDVADGAGR